jgi:hypothetical protein
MRSKTATTVLAGSGVLLLGLATGCGAAHKASANVHAAASAAAAIKTAAAAGNGAAPAVSDISLRVANMFSSSRTPGGPLDIYDVQLNNPNTTTKPVPIISAVAYGAFSDYVHPHIIGSFTKTIQLEALPAGDDPVADGAQAQGIGGMIDDGSGAQATLELQGPGPSDTLLDGPLAGLSFTTVMEKGDDGQGGKGPAAPAVTGSSPEILASAGPAENMFAGAHSYYLFVDSSCAPPLNGDSDIKGLPYIFATSGGTPASSFAVFATTAGAHHLTVVTNNDSTLPKCSDLAPRQGGADVTLAPGQQALAFAYGPKPTEMNVAVGAIQQ